MFWFCLNNVPRTPALSFSHACIENRPFLAHPGSKRCLTPFRLGKIRAGRKSLAVLKSRFLREYAINFGNSFFASSVYVSSTGYDSLSSGVNTIGGLGMIMWVYRFLWNTRYQFPKVLFLPLCTSISSTCELEVNVRNALAVLRLPLRLLRS